MSRCPWLSGLAFRHSEAVSFQIATKTQEEKDRYWNAMVGNGGTESQCGWCEDRWGLSCQITPRALTDALAAGGGEAKRAFEAMQTMKKNRSSKKSRRAPKPILRLPYLDHAKAAVLNSLTCPEAQRRYRHLARAFPGESLPERSYACTSLTCVAMYQTFPNGSVTAPLRSP